MPTAEPVSLSVGQPEAVAMQQCRRAGGETRTENLNLPVELRYSCNLPPSLNTISQLIVNILKMMLCSRLNRSSHWQVIGHTTDTNFNFNSSNTMAHQEDGQTTNVPRSFKRLPVLDLKGLATEEVGNSRSFHLIINPSQTRR